MNLLTTNEYKFLQESYIQLNNDTNYNIENYYQEDILSKILQNVSKHILSKRLINEFITPHYGDISKSYKALLDYEKTMGLNSKTVEAYIKEIKGYEYMLKNLDKLQTMSKKQRNDYIIKNFGISKWINDPNKIKKYILRKKNLIDEIKKNEKNFKVIKQLFKNGNTIKEKYVKIIENKINLLQMKFEMIMDILKKHPAKTMITTGIAGGTAMGGTASIIFNKRKFNVIKQKSESYKKAAKQAVTKKDYRSAIRNYMNSLKVWISAFISNLNVPTSIKKAMRTTSGKAIAVASSLAILATGYFLVKIISKSLIALAMKILNGVASAIKAGKAVATSLYQRAYSIAKKIIANFKSKFK